MLNPQSSLSPIPCSLLIAKQQWKHYTIPDLSGHRRSVAQTGSNRVSWRASGRIAPRGANIQGFEQRGCDMKEISELVTPQDLRYTKDHEWARLDGETIRIGITDYAQDQLGDVVFVEVPEVGKKYKKGDACGTLESVKAVAEVFVPIGGAITGVNTALDGSPELVNSAPYTDGWIADVKPSDPSEMDSLMDHNAYLEMLKGLKE
jgi:glycine cleavage system H protein